MDSISTYNIIQQNTLYLYLKPTSLFQAVCPRHTLGGGEVTLDQCLVPVLMTDELY